MDALTQHLADALREVVVCTKEWNEAIEAIIGRFPNTGIGLDRGKEALAAFDAAKDAPEDDALTAAYMAGSASRLDELRAKDAEIAALKAVIGRVQHEWQVDDIDKLQVAMYSAGDFRKGKS